MRKFSNVERNMPQKVHIYWTMITEDDDMAEAPDERDEGFWPSRDPNDAGYVGDSDFDEHQRMAEERMRGWRCGNWSYIGVIAKATVYIPIGGNSFRVMELQSGGLWGIESDSDDYIKDVYEEEKTALLDELLTLGAALANNGVIHKD